MSPHVHFDYGSWEFPASLALTLLLVASLYLRVWISTRSGSAAAIPAWKASSFLLGLVLVWMAWGSPLAAYDHSLLTVHMIKHLLLMTFAPPLILLGEPMKVFWGMMPLSARSTLGRVWHRPLIQRLVRIVTSLVLCWTASALTLIAWHVPRYLRSAYGLKSGIRSSKQCSSELGFCFGGLLFSLGQAPQLGRDGRYSCTFFWRLCRATSFPGFSSSLTVSHTRCIFPRRDCLVFPFLKISSVRPH